MIAQEVQEEKTIAVTAENLLVLLYNLLSHNKKHGHMDANKTPKEIIDQLTFKTRLNISTLESLLYCCNMNDEEKAFWHPYDAEFDTFVKKIAPNRKFNKQYNWLEDRG